MRCGPVAPKQIPAELKDLISYMIMILIRHAVVLLFLWSEVTPSAKHLLVCEFESSRRPDETLGGPWVDDRQPVASPSASTSLPVFPAFECVSVDSRGPSAGCVTIRQDQLKYIIPFKIPIMLLIQVLQKQWNHFTMKTFSGLTTRWQQCGTLSVGLGGPLWLRDVANSPAQNADSASALSTF